MERCRDDLSRLELKHLTISEIALRWGLPNPPHFSQSFRTMFGMTASEYRAKMTGIGHG
jgi:AraC-like DNA-binding protein